MVFGNCKYTHFFAHCKCLAAFCCVLALGAQPAAGQRLSGTFLTYIDQYKQLAVQHAQQYGVPASITLAQGLLESGAGTSTLARKGNNHFGIKCHSSWKGDRITVGDGSGSICYRQYDKAEDSFLDHARFLQGKRYSSLYKLKGTDYKGWARGLQRAGYAEDPAYAVQLIRLIEQYRLFQYDTGQPIVAHREHLSGGDAIGHEPDEKEQRALLKKVEFLHSVHRKWGLHYVIAMHGDTWESIALEFNLKPDKLRAYNDTDPDLNPVPAVGERVWVEQKAARAPEGFETYEVRPGDTPQSIAQEFGIRLGNLERMNLLKAGAVLSPGQRLRLR